MRIFDTFQRIEITGDMPERALLRLQRAGISVYKVKKTQKNRLICAVNGKDIEKVFAIFPNLCYNSNSYDPYTVRPLGAVGLGKITEFIKKRVGFAVGALCFCILSLATQDLTLGVDIVGSHAYAREIRATLCAYGIEPWKFYKSGNEDLICAELLTLDSVEFCSVQKHGRRVRVEMRLGDTIKRRVEKGDMRSAFTGELTALTVLKGTPLKKVGDTVREGEVLVGGYFLTGVEGAEEKTETLVVARAKFACVYESIVTATTAEEAFATAYLQITRFGEITLTKTEWQETAKNAFSVRLEYETVQAMNMDR